MSTLKRRDREALILIVSVAFALLLFTLAHAEPTGVSFELLGNETAASTNGTLINGTPASSAVAGGYIYWVNISGTQQNTRWKGYVGNVSGQLVLDDSSGNTLFDWSLSTPGGEVYATRTWGVVNWTGIKCAPQNATYQEDHVLNHSNIDDNITATFDPDNQQTNQQWVIGDVTINANTCGTINVNSSSVPSDAFEESVLYDNPDPVTFNFTTGLTGGQNPAGFSNVVYVSRIENDQTGFQGGNTQYDFQTILPERGHGGWVSSTAYYFYVELL